MSSLASNFAKLADLDRQSSSEDRRALLRQATETLSHGGHSPEELAVFDRTLATLAREYSVQVRAELARLVSHNDGLFAASAQLFALDEIEVARPILAGSTALSEETLLRVIAEKSQDHLMAVTKRGAISERISHALVERGNDDVVSSLLKNERATIGDETFDIVATRAQDSVALQGPLVARTDVPPALLNELYVSVEAALRETILEKIGDMPPEEIERAFRHSRRHFARRHSTDPADLPAARKRVDELERRGALTPSALASLMREGAGSRTAFALAFSRLADVPFDIVQRVVDKGDLDTVALLCRGANFERGLFVTLAIGLDDKKRALGGAEEFARLYESVPVAAAQRALRFWKARAAA